MAKKGENIYKRKDGRWEGRYIKGRRENGKSRFGYIYGKSYREVRQRLLPLKLQYAGTKTAEEGFGGTFADWSRYWLSEIVRLSVKRSTYAFYYNILGKYALPEFGSRKLNGILGADIQCFIDKLNRKGLKPGTVRGIAGLINRIFRSAVAKHAILVNPCKEVTLPRKESPQKKVMERAAQAGLEQAAQKDKHGSAILLSLYTGMRIGEIAALTWEDVDLEAGIIRVRRTMQRVTDGSASGHRTRLIFDRPKSVHSERKIPLTLKVKKLLEQEKEGSKSPYVVSCSRHFAEPRIIRYHFGRILRKAGLGKMTFHSLRHTFATRCMETGMDVTTLSRILGHASVKMTLDIYTDSTWQQKAKAIRRLDDLYKGKALRVAV